MHYSDNKYVPYLNTILSNESIKQSTYKKKWNEIGCIYEETLQVGHIYLNSNIPPSYTNTANIFLCFTCLCIFLKILKNNFDFHVSSRIYLSTPAKHPLAQSVIQVLQSETNGNAKGFHCHSLLCRSSCISKHLFSTLDQRSNYSNSFLKMHGPYTNCLYDEQWK